MSYKDGIPLLASFDDDVDDDDLSFQNIRPPSKCPKCSKRTAMFSIVLSVAVALIIALIVGITVPVLVLPNTGSGVKHIPKPEAENDTTSTILITVAPSLPAATRVVVNTSSVDVRPTVSLAISSTSQPQVPSPLPTSVEQTPSPSSATPSPSSATPSPSSAPKIKSSSIPILSHSPSPSPVSFHLTTHYVMSTSSAVSPTPSVTPTPLPVNDENCTVDNLVCPSKLDDRNYAVMTLGNGLRVLLISDPNSNISAAAMDVPAGSFNDPPDYEGLAHFCEHMLFIGTKKYPETNQYSSFLQTHGGRDNAYTSTQNTNYFFSVEAEYFSTALDMFAHFFIDPLFSVESVMDEMNAVNAEHQKNLHTDGWKLWQLLKNVSNPQHPFSQFSTGSLETLNKSDTHDQLLRYFNSSYSANNMQLVVYGRDDLNTLSHMTTRSFSAVPNRNVTKATYNETSFPPPQYSGFIVHYYPEANTDVLTVYWQVAPSLQPRYRNAVGSFITRYLGHEGTTGAAHMLKMMNYATSLTASIEVETDSYTLFVVQIELMENGIRNVSDVVRVLFQHVVRFRSMSESEFSRLWDDFKPVSQIKFDYSERATPYSYVSSVASSMRTTTDPADFLSNPVRYMDSFNLTNSTLAQFTPHNSVIFLGTHKITFSPEVAEELNYTSDSSPLNNTEVSGGVQFPFPELDTIEQLYRTPFHRERIPDELLAYWDVANDSNLSLPPSNMFIPTDFSIISKSTNDSDMPTRLDFTDTDNKLASMWWLLDTDDFREPRVNLMCQLNNTDASISPAWNARSRLFARFWEAVLEPRLYDATLVGYSYSVKSYTHGLMLSFSGPADRLSPLISQVVSGDVLNANILRNQTALFNIAKASLVDELENYNFTRLAFRYTAQYLQKVVMERPYWTNEEVLTELRGVNLTELVDFGVDRLTGSGTTLLCLAHGNVDAATAGHYRSKLVRSRLEDGLNPFQTTPQFLGHYWRQRVNLSAPGNYSIVVPTLNPEDDNSVVNVIFQIGEVCHIDGIYNDRVTCSNDSLLMSLHLALTTQLIKDECFTFLRTINKLGYVAFCFVGNYENVGSFQVLVQSEAFDGDYVYGKITELLEDYVFSTVLNQSNLTQFAQFIDSQKAVLKSVLERKEPNLNERTRTLWSKVQHGQLTFDLLERQLQLLDSNLINATSVLNFYREYILNPATHRKMIIVVNGKDRDFRPDVTYPLDYTHLPDSYPAPDSL